MTDASTAKSAKSTTDAPKTGGSSTPDTSTLAELSAKLAAEVTRLDSELAEVDLIIAQATTEATRHESRRSTAAEKLTALTKQGEPTELGELSTQVASLTRRAALMESQVEVLEGKRRALARHRESVAGYADLVAAMDPATSVATAQSSARAVRRTVAAANDGGDAPMAPAVSRLVLTSQEDLRREISRAMHDGPAQSLTNIVLQAQIVERLVAMDPASALGEVHQLIGMVQRTLEATKTFIFDVRPMVLDDLGLVPTLRRSARERGRRAGVAVDFDSMGQDRRLPMDLESGLFRILDEALVGYLERSPTRITMRLDWADQVEARVHAVRAADPDAKPAPPAVEEPASGAELPPALRAMMEDRRADARDAAETARRDAIVALPVTTWQEIQSRADTLGILADLSEDGSELHLVAEAPVPTEG
jgi:two-component system, NarL family, sensor histidine kinase DegS